MYVHVPFSKGEVLQLLAETGWGEWGQGPGGIGTQTRAWAQPRAHRGMYAQLLHLTCSDLPLKRVQGLSHAQAKRSYSSTMRKTYSGLDGDESGFWIATGTSKHRAALTAISPWLLYNRGAAIIQESHINPTITINKFQDSRYSLEAFLSRWRRSWLISAWTSGTFIGGGSRKEGYLHLLVSTLSLRAAGPATILSHKCDIPSLLMDDQIARDNRLPVHCRHLAVAATSYCHPCRLLFPVWTCTTISKRTCGMSHHCREHLARLCFALKAYFFSTSSFQGCLSRPCTKTL